MRELGADEHGRISYQEFLRRRLALRPEIEALRAGKRRSSPHHTHTPEYLPTSSDNSLGKSRTNRSNFPEQIPASVAFATINHLGRGEYRFLVRRFRKHRRRLFDETRRMLWNNVRPTMYRVLAYYVSRGNGARAICAKLMIDGTMNTGRPRKYCSKAFVISRSSGLYATGYDTRDRWTNWKWRLLGYCIFYRPPFRFSPHSLSTVNYHWTITRS